MSAAATIGKKAIRLTNGIINLAVLIVILLLLVFGGYVMWDSGKVYGAASATHYASYKPTAENSLTFQDLQAINSEVTSWLTVYGTNIDYPVVQGADNMKYINTDAKGRYSLSGAIFLDAKCSPDFSDFSSILYGHHMDKEAMFGEIGLFSDKSYFDARRYGQLYYGGQEHGVEFFAFAHADAYDELVYRTKVVGQDTRQAYLEHLMELAINTRKDVSVTPNDRIVLLSTCSNSSTNGRDILVGKITNQTYADPFKIKTTDKPGAIPVISAASDFWTEASLPVKIIVIVLPLLLILLGIVLTYSRRKHSRKDSEGVERHV
jgi:sortase B